MIYQIKGDFPPFLLYFILPVFLCGFISAAQIRKADEDKTPPLSIPYDLIANLQIGDSNSRRGRTTPNPLAPITTTTRHPALVDQDSVLYRLTNQDGRACILILTDAIIAFNFTTNLKEERSGNVYMPSAYEGSGNCDSGDNAQITISWKNFAWTVMFSKTPGGDHWYVAKMILNVDREEKQLEHINRQEPIIHFESTDQGGMMFPTPVGKAYACDDEVPVKMTNGDATAVIILRKLKMQPFIFKNDFGPEHACSPGGGKSYRDEAAPIAVGSTLAIVSILTVSGYGVYRYVKVKKVQYDTME